MVTTPSSQRGALAVAGAMQRRDLVGGELSRFLEDRVDEVFAQIAQQALFKPAGRPATDFSVCAISETGALYIDFLPDGSRQLAARVSASEAALNSFYVNVNQHTRRISNRLSNC
jgi:hypothetical protein